MAKKTRVRVGKRAILIKRKRSSGRAVTWVVRRRGK